MDLLIVVYCLTLRRFVRIPRLEVHPLGDRTLALIRWQERRRS